VLCVGQFGVVFSIQCMSFRVQNTFIYKSHGVKLWNHLNKLQTNDEHMHKLTMKTSPQKFIATMGRNNQYFNLGIKKAYHIHLGVCETRELNHLMLVEK